MRPFRLLLLATGLALSWVPAAEAQDVPCVCPPGQYCANPPIATCLVNETVGPQRAPRPGDATATRAAAVAYGEGTTRCTFSLAREQRIGTANTWDFEGYTSCTSAIAQTGQAWLTGAGTAFAPLCSGTRYGCSSAGSATGNYTGMRYRVTLVAPAGQGWIASPEQCSGAGTDRLECTF